MSVANPWLAENWNLTAQGDYVKKYGVSVAARKAREAGTVLGALKPRVPLALYNNLTIIQRKSSSTSGGGGGGGGGLVGAGSSGNGPPT